jgi:hypothetical protein
LVALRLHHQRFRISLLIKLVTAAGDVQSSFGSNQFDGSAGEAGGQRCFKRGGPFAWVL